jgi:hypothetical protein
LLLSLLKIQDRTVKTGITLKKAVIATKDVQKNINLLML